jgi:5-methylcytosine-specific restriction endonuclease McrA
MKKLADQVSKETGKPFEEIMLLRHGNNSISLLKKYGVSIDEYTASQPINNRYDYNFPQNKPIRIVVVVIQDQVFGVYEVLGIDAEGTNYSITSPAYQRFERERNIPEVDCRRYFLKPIYSSVVGSTISGWENRSRTTVQRSNNSFYHDILIEENSATVSRENNEIQFFQQVDDAVLLDGDVRRSRLSQASGIPRRIEVTTTIFERSPFVVAEALAQAMGICQNCKQPAPFHKRTNGEPYLEVHHVMPLSKGGLDVMENVIALCPNCHRKTHYG